MTDRNRLTPEELQQLRQTDFNSQPGFVSAETVLAKEVGAKGTPERAEFDARAFAWYSGEFSGDKEKASE